jgi:hypothetical protein
MTVLAPTPTNYGMTSVPNPAPTRLTIVATCLLTALINHEYQHDQWICEVRAGRLGHALPADPDSGHVRRIDGYLVLHP